MHRTDRYRILSICRIGDRQSDEDLSGLLRAESRLPVTRVSAGNHHHDAGLNSSIYFLAQRTVPATVPFWIEGIAEAHVHAVHRNLFAGCVQFAEMLEGQNRTGRVTFPVFIQNFQAKQPALRCNSGRIARQLHNGRSRF